MPDGLRRRMVDAASGPSGPPDLAVVAARAAELDRRARILRSVAAVAVVVLVVGVGVVVVGRPSARSTRVISTPTSPPVESFRRELLVSRGVALQIIDADTGAALRTISVQPTYFGPLEGPIAVSPDGKTAFVTVTVSVACSSRFLLAVDLRTAAASVAASAAGIPALSPDGLRLAYVRYTGTDCTPNQVVIRTLRSGSEQSWTIGGSRAAGRAPETLTSLNWAPDGRHVIIGSTFGPATGIQILDTGQPVGPSNPATVGPATDPNGLPGGRYLDPALLPDGQLIAVAPQCWGAISRTGCDGPSGLVTLDPSTGKVVSTIIDPQRPPGVDFSGLSVDRSGQRIAVIGVNRSGDTGLYLVSAHALSLLATRVVAATWLSQTVQPQRRQPTTSSMPVTTTATP